MMKKFKAIVSFVAAIVMSVLLNLDMPDMSVLEMVVAIPAFTIIFTPVIYLLLTIAPFVLSFIFGGPGKDLQEPKN